MSTSVESFNKRKRIEEQLLISSGFCKEPELLMPPVDKASDFLPSSQVKIETLKNPITPKPALTQADFSVADAADESWFGNAMLISYEFLVDLTKNFSSDNYIGRTQYAMLYKGLVPDGCKQMRSGEVTIKMWKNEKYSSEGKSTPEHPESTMYRMEQELKFLLQPDISMSSYTVNVLGFCSEENKLGVVYDLKPLETLAKYIDNDKFGWRDRVNVAVKLAHLLKFLHENEPRYIVRNLSPAHVMLDQDLNPVLIDYATIHRGLLGGLTNGVFIGLSGYCYAEELLVGPHTERTDVFAYGVILMEMLRRCRYNSRELIKNGRLARIDAYACHMYSLYKAAMQERIERGCAALYFSLAKNCLTNDPDYHILDGENISLLALRCVRRPIPTIGEVVNELKELELYKGCP